MTSRRKNQADGTSASLSALADMMQTPAANSLLASQRLALEAAKFWARRMRAYADQMETLASCSSTDEFARAQTKFIERMREDYAAESEAMSELLSPATFVQRGEADARAEK